MERKFGLTERRKKMNRKLIWNVDKILEVKDIIYMLETIGMCLNDEIHIKIEEDYSFTITYTTDNNGDNADIKFLTIIEKETGIKGKEVLE